ncbi:MAG: hypothetical protein IRZ11_07845 [Clostridia bacterium]|nr:hypothetical protein [Clostridia bacterium]
MIGRAFRGGRNATAERFVVVAAAALAAALAWRVAAALLDPGLHPFWLFSGYALAAKLAGDAALSRLGGAAPARPGSYADDLVLALRWMFPLVVFQRLVEVYPWFGPATPLLASPLLTAAVYVADAYVRSRDARGQDGSLHERLAGWP